MKTLLILSLFILTINLNSNELQWVDEQIQAIKPPRNGVSTAKINAVKDPFIFLKKTEKASKKTVANRAKVKTSTTSSSKNKISKKKQSFTLDAIINNSALINGKWYSLNQKVGKHTLTAVNTTNVVLSYKKKELFLSTRSKSQKLKFKNN